MELVVLGSSGSYASARGACSGYLVRTAEANLWLDCGNGTLATLHEYCDPGEIDAVVITHEHPDHCADIYGMHVAWRYGLERSGLPVFAPSGAEQRLGALVSDWGVVFDWRVIEDSAPVEIKDARLDFRRTDHPIPTFAVEVSADSTRLIYTADTGPAWSVGAFDHGADLVLAEASYLHSYRRTNMHLSAHEAGEMAKNSSAGALMLTHLWPTLDADASLEEGSKAFGAPATLATPRLVTNV